MVEWQVGDAAGWYHRWTLRAVWKQISLFFKEIPSFFFLCLRLIEWGLSHIIKDQSVQSFSHGQLFATPWTAVRQASLFITNSWSLLKLMSIESVMPSNHLVLCHPFLLPPSVFPSISAFSNNSALHVRWPKYWSFSFSISPSKEYSRLISFGIDWFDLLTVQGTLKSLLQHHSSKASFFGAQLSL